MSGVHHTSNIFSHGLIDFSGFCGGVIKKGIRNRRVGNLQNQGLSSSVLADQKGIPF